MATRLLVVGGPSIDTLHFGGQTTLSAGGAGLYTALAACRCGSHVTMYGPKPNPMPTLLQPAENRLNSWLGPVIPPEKMPHFKISYDGNKASYMEFFIGEEARLDPEAMPRDLSIFDCVHITALGDADKQLQFLRVCRERRAKIISLGTFLCLIKDNPEKVRALLEKSDIFFANEQEAINIFGSIENAITQPGKVLYVTLGEKGAVVVQGSHQTHLPVVPSAMLEPTGAGDTFCGATLSNLMQGMHPVMAARKAMALAAQEIEQVGPSTLLWNQPPPSIPFDGGVNVNDSQIQKISIVIKQIPEAEPYHFVDDFLPPVDHPSTLDYFFVTTLQQFGFWETVANRYDHPLVAIINGRELKGSSYLFSAYLRRLTTDPGYFTPERQTKATEQDLRALFRADDGSDPMPAVDLHLSQAQQYGFDMSFMGMTPLSVIEESQKSVTPFGTFLSFMDRIGGYKEDPLRKKTNLLALSLNERPEKFLPLGEEEHIPPVIDYHTMRFCLRTGIIEVMDHEMELQLTNREVVTHQSEWAVRYASFVAVEKLVLVSGLSMGAIDNITFRYNRNHCPEMTEPDCRECALDPACEHRKELFQPVIRTVFY